MSGFPWPPQIEEEMSDSPLVQRLIPLFRRAKRRSFQQGFAAGVEVTIEQIVSRSPHRRKHAYHGPVPPELADWGQETIRRVREAADAGS